MMGAKNIFLMTEGDAWYRRNREKLEEESGFSAVDLMIDFLNRQKNSLGGGKWLFMG